MHDVENIFLHLSNHQIDNVDRLLRHHLLKKLKIIFKRQKAENNALQLQIPLQTTLKFQTVNFSTKPFKFRYYSTKHNLLVHKYNIRQSNHQVLDSYYALQTEIGWAPVMQTHLGYSLHMTTVIQVNYEWGLKVVGKLEPE